MSSTPNAPRPASTTLDFLSAMDSSPTATFNIECYTDVPKGADKPKPDRLMERHANLSLADIEARLPHLEALNAQGAGIFFAVNEFDGNRQKGNLTKVRGVHADLDGVDEAAREALAARLPPSMAVETSGPDHQHWYWLTDEGETLAQDQAEAINRSHVAYGADKAAVDVTRLLRVPGFRHMKRRESGDTPTVRVVAEGPRYKVEELLRAFGDAPALNASPPSTPVPTVTSATTHVDDALIARIESEIRASFPALWEGRWDSTAAKGLGPPYKSQSEADLAMAGHIARQCADLGLPKDSWPGLVEAVFNRCGLANRLKWQERSDYRHTTIQLAVGSVEARTSMIVPLDSHGDIRNAKALAHLARGRLLYVATRDRWLIWK